MRTHGVEVTRANYLAIAYPQGLPAPWTMELEQQLPPEIRGQK